MSRRDEPAAGWVMTPLSELLTGIESGKSFQCEERPPVAGEVGVVKVSAVSWGEYREQESKTCTTADRVNADYFIRPGDFLFSRANTIELVGACVVARQVTLRVMLSDKILRLQFLWDDLKPWMLHFLGSKAGRLQIETLASGNQESMRNIGQERLGQILVPLPPQAEQARIVAKLEELLSELDAGVAELKAAQAKLKQYRQSLLKAAVEGALTAEWRARNPPQETGTELLARILRERRARWEVRQLAKFKAKGTAPPKDWQAKYPEPVKPDDSALPELPGHWCWTSLDTLGELASGVAKGSKTKPGEVLREVPYLRVANVQRGRLDLDEVKTILATERDIAELSLVAGDVLFNEGGDRDKLGRGWVWSGEVPECIHQNHVFRMRPVLPDIAPDFVSHHGNTFGRRWFESVGKQTTNLASINLSILRSFPVPVPPADEQREIVALVQEQLAVVQEQEIAVDRGQRLAAAQRQNILRAAFAGQLVPQDPADEPASALLARIRAERAARAAAPEARRPRKRRETT